MKPLCSGAGRTGPAESLRTGGEQPHQPYFRPGLRRLSVISADFPTRVYPYPAHAPVLACCERVPHLAVALPRPKGVERLHLADKSAVLGDFCQSRRRVVRLSAPGAVRLGRLAHEDKELVRAVARHVPEVGLELTPALVQ